MDLEPLDPVYVKERLAQPPFVVIHGVDNVRDLCFLHSPPRPNVKPGLVYRAAELSAITPQGKDDLISLGIRKVFDMRSDPELKKFAAPLPDISGVEVVRTPVFKNTDYSPEMMAERFKLYASGKTEAFMQLYSQILEHGGPAFATILRHIKDNPAEPCIFHCTAGKDRTGVMAALILKLADVDNSTIAEDYALTRVGREPARDKVMARLLQMPLFATDNEAMLNMFTCRSETMISFLQLLDGKYGGVESYLKTHVGITDEEIHIIRRNILP